MAHRSVDQYYYIRLPVAAAESAKKDLTLTPRGKDEDAFVVYEELGDGILVVPRYYGLKNYGVPQGSLDGRSRGLPLNPAVTFCGVLKSMPPQEASVASALDVLTSPVGGCILQLGCGQGKTVCAIALCHALGRRTAILVNNGKTLLPQWMDRLAQFLPAAKVGLVRSAQNDLEDPTVDVVVCVIQSLVRRRYNQDVLDTVGTVIVDECHHVGARVFGQCMRQFKARYTIGLTATPDRKDGLRRYVEWLLGDVVVRCPTDFLRIYVLRYTYKDAAIRPHTKAKDHLQRCLMVNDAVKDPFRSLFLLKVTLNIVKESPRSVLLLTERVQQVDDFAEYIRNSGFDGPVARLHGNVDRADVEAAAGARIVVSSYPMANEALDIPHLDTIVCLTPFVGFIEQIVGRIVRIARCKCVPLVVDIDDGVGLFAGMARTRARWYDRVMVREVATVTVSKADTQDQDRYNAVKPSAVVPQWLSEPDPWNTDTGCTATKVD